MSNDNTVYHQAISDGMPSKLAMLITAQARFESGNYSSNVFRSCNNLFGYKWVGQSSASGPCLQSPEGDYYAAYSSIAASVHEICQWIKRRVSEGKFPSNLSSIDTPEYYAQLLKSTNYFTGTLSVYTNGLIAELQQISISGSDTGALLLAGLAILILVRR